ncbi:Fc.00g072060.m01.CDS01 [Cosmosporella sp. VM-42]
METSLYEIGIVGYGSSARTFHIPFVQASPCFHLHSIVQRQAGAGQADATRDLPDVKVHKSLDVMLQDAQIHLVVVTTPPESHLEVATAALKANKHVVVEKPFTPTFEEAEELILLAKDRKLLLTVYQNRRWDRDFLTLKTLKKQGTLGRVVDFESHFDRYRPTPPTNTWKANPSPGNGAIYDLGAHLIDQVVHLFGTPTSVTGFIGSQRTTVSNPTGLDDSFTVLLHYSDGMLATIKAGVISPELQQLRFWIRGDRGSFRKYGFDPQEAQLKRGMRPNDVGFGIEEGDESSRGLLAIVVDNAEETSFIGEPVPIIEKSTGYAEFYRQLAFALDKGESGKPPVAAEEAAQVIRLVELARKSSELGRTMKV